ncbi:hypothetical protein KsCSTR_26550 [Candidatus Kuenenia stuttgartiensis]|uniref:Uncharacterized protein n=1 Tax=Kuenenia stuttgartiensis TaxID=174633 RepID=A0A6G7GRQ0_KUEST|nr:hypothetical protein KsCSTR_26550 [Candidatus Kuenenia stuttgartiensis]
MVLDRSSFSRDQEIMTNHTPTITPLHRHIISTFQRESRNYSA